MTLEQKMKTPVPVQMDIFELVKKLDREAKKQEQLENKLNQPPQKKKKKRIRSAYGVKLKHLKDNYSPNEVGNCLHGYKNVTASHELIDSIPETDYIPALFIGVAMQKRPTVSSEKIVYSSPEELIAKLIFIGQRISLENKENYETILKNVTESLSDVSKEDIKIFVDSFKAKYLPSNRECPGRKNFYDSACDARTVESTKNSQAEQFYRALKTKLKKSIQ